MLDTTPSSAPSPALPRHQPLRLHLRAQHLHPAWFQRVRQGTFECTVEADGDVVLLGERLRVAPHDVLAPGQRVRVWLGRDGHFTCADVLVLELQRQEREAAERARDEERKRLCEQRLREARAFNAGLHVPVRWTPGIKDVLSGLTEHSHGNGFNAATVAHVLLQEPLAQSRLRRQAGDFLCTARSGTNGKHWSGDRTLSPDARVSCKACLRLAARWMRGA